MCLLTPQQREAGHKRWENSSYNDNTLGFKNV